MRFIKEEIKNITLYDQPETNEALTLLHNKKHKLIWLKIFSIFFLLFMIASIITVAVSTDYTIQYSFIPCIPISFIIAFILFIIRYVKLRPYYKLYKIARHNDRIRNDEHIRYNERKRLDEENLNNNSLLDKAKIDNTINKLNISTQIDKKEIKQDKKVLPPKK